jgi:thioesterase domain-containing protein
MNKIQQQFERNLPLAALLQGGTIEQLASVIREQPDASPWTPLVTIQPNGSKRPFFCVPGAGGNVLYLYHLARHLGLVQPFYGLQARGLDGEQPAHTRIEDIAADNIQALQAIQPHGPYVLGGHSFGSYVAFEMAQQLQQKGQEVALLAILDTPATIPGNQPTHNDDAQYLTDLAMTIESFFDVNLSVSYDQLQPLSPETQLDDLLQRLKQTGIFPPEAKAAQLRGLLQVFKTSAQTSYAPQEGYPHRIAVFRAQEGQCNQPDMGWNQVCLQPVETYCVPGDHITMVAEPHVQVLAEQLRTCLDQV